MADDFGATEDARTGSGSSRLAVARRFLVVLVAVVALVAGACSSNDDAADEAEEVVSAEEAEDASTEDEEPEPEEDPAAERAAMLEEAELIWDSVAVGLADLTDVSDLLEGHERLVRATVTGPAYEGGVVTIWTYDGGAWSDVAVFEDLWADPTGLDTVDATGDGVEEFSVQSSAATNYTISVIAELDGVWSVVSFGPPDPEFGPSGGMNVEFTGDGTATTFTRWCVPNCATGGGSELLWRFDADLGFFEVDLTGGVEAAHTEMCQAIAHEDASDFVSAEIVVEGTTCGVASWLIIDSIWGSESEQERLRSVGWECTSEDFPDAELAYTAMSCGVAGVTVSWDQF